MIFWLCSVKQMLLGCRCWFLLKRIHCILAGLSLSLYMIISFTPGTTQISQYKSSHLNLIIPLWTIMLPSFFNATDCVCSYKHSRHKKKQEFTRLLIYEKISFASKKITNTHPWLQHRRERQRNWTLWRESNHNLEKHQENKLKQHSTPTHSK